MSEPLADLLGRYEEAEAEVAEAERALVKEIALCAGGAIAYVIYRRLGAPRWAALGLVDVAIRLERLRDS